MQTALYALVLGAALNAGAIGKGKADVTPGSPIAAKCAPVHMSAALSLEYDPNDGPGKFTTDVTRDTKKTSCDKKKSLSNPKATSTVNSDPSSGKPANGTALIDIPVPSAHKGEKFLATTLIDIEPTFIYDDSTAKKSHASHKGMAKARIDWDCCNNAPPDEDGPAPSGTPPPPSKPGTYIATFDKKTGEILKEFKPCDICDQKGDILCWPPTTPKAKDKSINSVGAAGEAAVAAMLKECKFRIYEQVPVECSGSRTIDLIVDTGKKVCYIEIKANGANYSSEQKDRDECINKGKAKLKYPTGSEKNITLSQPPPTKSYSNGDTMPAEPTAVVRVPIDTP